MSTRAELAVRSFGPGDADAIRDLAVDRFLSDPAWSALPSELVAIQVRSWSASVLDRLASIERGLLAELDGRVVGVLTWAPGVERLHFGELTVCSTARRSGIGSLLLASALAEADAARVPSSLRVLASNPAISIYRRLGFTVAGVEPPNLLMTRAPGTLHATAPEQPADRTH